MLVNKEVLVSWNNANRQWSEDDFWEFVDRYNYGEFELSDVGE